MARTLSPLLLLAGLVAGCHKTSSAPACGDLATYNRSQCDITTLGMVERGGIWNVEVQWNTGNLSPGVFSLTPGSETIGGRPAQDKQLDSQTFYLASSYQLAGNDYRVALVGCGAQDAEHFGGEVLYCENGQLASSGLFKAAREVRASGEGESSHLALVSETPISSGEGVDVYVSNGYAYVSELSAGLTIFDVHDPTHPGVVAQLTPTGDSWGGAWVKGNVLYVASAAEGIILYDVSNPAQPQRISSLPSDKPDVAALFVDGNRLYAASPDPNGEVLIYDISTPGAPALLSRFKSPEEDPTAGYWPTNMFALGNTLYVNHWALGYVVVDVTDPTQPKEQGVFSWADATSDASAVGTLNGKTYAFVGDDAWDGHLRVLDVSTPAQVTQVSEFQLRPQNSIHNMVLVGSKLYAAHYQEGIRVLDVSDPTKPTQVGYFNTWRETDPGRGKSFFEGASGIRVPGDGYIYATESSRGLMVFQEN